MSYNSCRNRHCPKCGASSRARWYAERRRDLLPVAGPEQVLGYLARYTHRTAVANARMVELAEGRLTFRYNDTS